MNEYELDKIASEYHQAHLPDMFIENLGQLYETDWIQSRIPRNSHIVDLGYGDGIVFDSLLDFANRNSCQITMVEGSRQLVEKAKSHSRGRANIVHGFFENFIPTDKADVILASHVLEHVDDPVSLLKHLQSYSNPGAKLVGLVPNKESIHRRLATIMGLQPELDSLSSRDILVGHQRVYSLDTLERDFSQTNWCLSQHRGFFLKPFSNLQLTNFSQDIIKALLKVSDELPTELCANIAFYCELKSI